MAERNQRNRWRCTVVGCNPVLIGEPAAREHEATGHRIAKWPIRSAAGKAKARRRNKTGYYDQYNVGPKSAEERGIIHDDYMAFGEDDF
ncbi:hypothetical protein [Arthrobacter woluwensis]|uniref:Uncharacterized protein n=1 Tax=Arthrobacter woluwensis TaxID=156980 RepID=A0A1H4TAC5_9MICC|nr:hypothetical protein [Arthrobacter woluwensis]SEB28961.1 hypothetical protein SAMN04489745_0028 [Arthrobacter woluwensis]SEC53094.1 hypothetical protein SAMN04489745_3105 [Arthrobacter woluwensis]